MENYFPNGLRILVVDDDPTFLKRMRMMLLSCHYKATTCTNPCSALSILRERSSEFDILLTDIHMPEMSGFDLLDIVRAEIHLPVILMSIDTQLDVMRKGLSKGASFFLMKPVDIHDVRNMWQYVVSSIHSKESEKLNGGIMSQKTPPIVNFITSDNRAATAKSCNEKRVMRTYEEFRDSSTTILKEGIRGWPWPKPDKGEKGKERKHFKERDEEHDFAGSRKRNIAWTNDLEKKFLDALDILGKAAVPSKIVRLMNVEGLTRYHVASHLQKHRLKKRIGPCLPSIPIAPDLYRGSSTRLDNSNQFPDQLMLFNAQSNSMPVLNPNLTMPMPRITPWPLRVPSTPTTYPMSNLSYVQACLKNLQLSGNNEANPSKGGPSFGTTPQANHEQFTVDLTDASNEFQGMDVGDSSGLLPEANIQPAEFGSNAVIFDESNIDFAAFEPIDVGEFIEAPNESSDLMQCDVWEDNTLSVPQFGASDNNIASDHGILLMSPGQCSSTADFGQQNSSAQAAESSSKMADDEDFGDLIENFAYGYDPLGHILDDDFRFRFA